MSSLRTYSYYPIRLDKYDVSQTSSKRHLSIENGPGIHREPKRPYKCKLCWEPTAAAESAENNEIAK